MSRAFATGGDCGRLLLRRVVVVAVALASLRPAAVPASPAEHGAADPAFDALVLQADEQAGRGDFVSAARSWTEAARHLSPGDRDNRRNLYDDIAEAYEKAVAADGAVVAEAVRTLDDYAARFKSAFPGEALDAKGVQIHEKLRALVPKPAEPAAEVLMPTPARPPQPHVEPTPPPSTTRPWKGLAIAGGVTTGLGVGMLGMFAGGYAYAKMRERQFDDPANECDVNDIQGRCADIDRLGRRAEAFARAGLVSASVLLTTGVTLLVVALRRKASGRTLAPVLSPTMAGLAWQQRF